MKIIIEHDSDDPKHLTLIKSVEMLLPNSGRVVIKAPYRWNGNSTPPMPIMRFLIPKWFYLIASLFHDRLCELAKTKEDREAADKDYKWIIINLYKAKITSFIGFAGVRLGAFWSTIKGKLK